jgi:tetratricopeptide (TPR) repeat protein
MTVEGSPRAVLAVALGEARTASDIPDDLAAVGAWNAGRLEEAIGLARRRAESTATPSAWATLAWMLLRSGQPKPAIAAAERALATDARDVRALSVAALAAARAGDRRAARRWADAAAEASQDDAVVHELRGHISLLDRRSDDARTAYARALGVTPSFGAAAGQAVARIRSREWAAGLEDLAGVLREHNDLPTYRLLVNEVDRAVGVPRTAAVALVPLMLLALVTVPPLAVAILVATAAVIAFGIRRARSVPVDAIDLYRRYWRNPDGRPLVLGLAVLGLTLAFVGAPAASLAVNVTRDSTVAAYALVGAPAVAVLALLVVDVRRLFRADPFASRWLRRL